MARFGLTDNGKSRATTCRSCRVGIEFSRIYNGKSLYLFREDGFLSCSKSRFQWVLQVISNQLGGQLLRRRLKIVYKNLYLILLARKHRRTRSLSGRTSRASLHTNEEASGSKLGEPSARLTLFLGRIFVLFDVLILFFQ